MKISKNSKRALRLLADLSRFCNSMPSCIHCPLQSDGDNACCIFNEHRPDTAYLRLKQRIEGNNNNEKVDN